MSDQQRRFDRYTEHARRALTLAQQEAAGLRHNYIGTEHLLLGLIREREGTAGCALARLQVDEEAVRRRVVLIIGEREWPREPLFGLDASSKRTIELAVDEARRMGHEYLGTEHLLLGLLRVEALGAYVLKLLGLPPETVGQATLEVMRERGARET